MQTTEERMQRISERTAQIKRENKKRKMQITCSVLLAASILIVVVMGNAMSGLVNNFSNTDINYASVTASIIGDGTAQGYILMGILCFLLGSIMTILLYRISDRTKQTNKENKDEF